MRKIKGKILSIFLIVLSIIAIGLNSSAHSGRTDANGGHKDNRNKSGLGGYHYHCGGHPAHLHKNGVCPYSSNKSTTSTSNKSSTSNSSEKTTTKTPSTVNATGVKINEKIDNLEVGKSKTFTSTITPSNATDKTITWKTSDESIATVNQNGEVIAKKSGSVDIIVTTSNGKTDTVRINVKEEPEKENDTIVPIIVTYNNVTNNVVPYNNVTS